MSIDMLNKFLKLTIKFVIVCLILFFIYILVTSNKDEQTKQDITTMQQQVTEMQVEIDELWKNIDALSENYTTIWIELYGENSWYETQEDKLNIKNSINQGE